MSEDFDKEAEREKLREKYEHDKQKREATEQMSELLLQGATMTNAHCSKCGDPIFRYEGQEFCPTCEKPVDRGQSENGEGETDDENEDDQIEVTTPSEDARVAFGEGDEESAEEGASPQTEAPAPEATEAPQPNRQSSQQHPTQPPQQPTQTANRQRQPPEPAPVETGEASVEGAREALVQTLTRFSQQAAATEDPQRAQEHLAAAREAAEALAELRR